VLLQLQAACVLSALALAGMALAPWDVLAAGRIRTDAEEEERRKTGELGRMMTQASWERNADERKMAAALEHVAREVGAKSIQAGEQPQSQPHVLT
jgi:aryl-alcohol dehydrogenase-like predicted oxidoreductase